MLHLRLIKALSYTGIVEATKDQPDVFVEDKATADIAVASGYFELVGESGDTQTPPEAEEPGKTLEEMTVSELETFATYKGVSLKGISKKADIIKKLREELSVEETENEVDYGSPTMVGLLNE